MAQPAGAPGVGGRPAVPGGMQAGKQMQSDAWGADGLVGGLTGGCIDSAMAMVVAETNQE